MASVRPSNPPRLASWIRRNIVGEGADARDYRRREPAPAGEPRDATHLVGFQQSAGEPRDAGRVLSAVGGAAGSVGAGAYALADPLQGLPVDKFQHGGICFATTLALGALGLPPSLSAAFVFTAATLGKEFVWDRALGRGHFDPRDIAANLSGSLAAYTALKVVGQGSREAPPVAPAGSPSGQEPARP